MDVDTLTTPRTLADIQWARRIAATRVQEAAARVTVEHGRVVDIYDIKEAVDAYLAGEAAGWPGRRPGGAANAALDEVFGGEDGESPIRFGHRP